MTLGEAGKNGVRTSDLGECQDIVNAFFKYGHRELDTARMYAEGTTEPVCIPSHPRLLDFWLLNNTSTAVAREAEPPEGRHD